MPQIQADVTFQKKVTSQEAGTFRVGEWFWLLPRGERLGAGQGEAGLGYHGPVGKAMNSWVGPVPTE